MSNFSQFMQKVSVEDWWAEMAEKGLCETLERRYGYYGHDIGVTDKEVKDMFLREKALEILKEETSEFEETRLSRFTHDILDAMVRFKKEDL